MADEITDNATPQTPPAGEAPAAQPAATPPPAPAPATPMFSEADVQRIASEAAAKAAKAAHDAAFAEARRTFQGKQSKDPKPPKQEAQADTPPAPQPEPQGIDHRKLRVFDRATAKLGLSDAAISRMERAFEAENPDDVTGWVTDYVNDLGLKPPQPVAPVAMPSQPAVTPNVNPQTQQNQAAASPPSSSTPAPKPVPAAAPAATPPLVDLPIDPSKWTAQQQADFIAREGGDPRDLGNPKNAAIWRKVGDMYRALGSRTQISLARR